MKKNKLVLIISTLVSLNSLSAQDITTASMFFAQVSKRYESIKNYSANIKINAHSSVSIGAVFFKRPSKLRIDFSAPKDQTIIFTEDMLRIHLPRYPAITLSQSVNTSNSGTNMATPKGLSLMRRAYTIAYETGATPVALDKGSTERVVVLTLHRRSINETFKTIRLSIIPGSKLIRRIEAWTLNGKKITFNFWNYKINQGIPDIKFIYDVPPEAPVLNNFLFSE